MTLGIAGRRDLISASLMILTLILIGAANAVAQDATASPAVTPGVVDDGLETAVEVKDFSFPADITIEAGSSVRWQNADPVSHTVTAVDGGFDSGRIEPGSSFDQVFAEPGVFAYSCQFHPAMTGTITVTTSGAAPSEEPRPSLGSGPSPAASPS